MKIFSDKKLTIKEVWLASLRLYSKTFSQVLPQTVVVGVITALLAWISTHINAKEMTTFNWISIFANLIALLLIIYLSSVVLYRIYMIGNGQKITLLASFDFVWGRFFKIACGMLLGLSIGILGLLALILPGVFLFILLIMVQPLIMFDDKGCFTALKDSCKLVWGNWWRSFVVFFPVMVLNCAVSFALQFISNHSNWWYGAIGSGLVAVFLYPLLFACLLIQFGDLKLRYHTKRHETSI